MNWRLFGGACILAAGLAIKFGAPIPAVVLGLAAAGGLNWWRYRGSVGK
jgi:hypothetical protein